MKGYKKTFLSLKMVLPNISVTISNEEMETHTFFLRNSQDIVMKHLALATDDEVVL